MLAWALGRRTLGIYDRTLKPGVGPDSETGTTHRRHKVRTGGSLSGCRGGESGPRDRRGQIEED